MRLGIQGGPASYHEVAAKLLHPKAELVYCETFTELFKAIRNGRVDSGLTAIANNRVQIIADPYEYLTAKDTPYGIVGEVYLRIEHALLAPNGAKLSDIRQVHSQAPALGQCSHFLEDKLPETEIIEETDTALAAQKVAQLGDKTCAAIASKAAAELYGLNVIKERVQNDQDNITRFLEIKLKEHVVTDDTADKTTLMLQTPQIPGALVTALIPFKKSKINLSSLQSKLIPNSPFEMQFFVEFEAGLQEQSVTQVLAGLHKNGYKIEILGSYKKAQIPLSEGEVDEG